MSLTMGTAPFGHRPAGEFNFDTPDRGALWFEDSPRRVRGILGGETVVDSRRVKLLHEARHLPVWYFPREDVRMELLEPSELVTHCPYKGEASHFTVRAGDREEPDAAWNYPEPIAGAPPFAGYIAFHWRAMDTWLEEDEEVFVHPRDPYHRIDVLDTSRHVRVLLRRRGAGRHHAREGAVRERAAHALVHPRGGPHRRVPRGQPSDDGLPVQGHRRVPLRRA